ncbi:hypothetical protein DAPPUDRAFT_315704 [Daphnia pulex]|uniref:Perilipin n=1 Tax=Daphnia pulex TaxID=6669 RepID=E9GAJ3_DAPPU|nr:hypothetical protein DAPPUDRAFT_315704 [Daphnia pulex]|eukprot:EFX83255.1 hypothetical protein DAPPUDRAFT_315704 [Daphnia pulex]
MVHSDIPQTPEFISRVANLPVVHSAIDYASDAYIKAKDYSPSLIKKTWSTAEDTLNYAASCVLPIVQTTFEKPIHAVDTLACKTLNKVEETLPVVTKTPEEIMTNTRSYVSDKLQPVQTGVSSAVNLVSGATDKLLNNRLARLTLHTAEFTVATVHECIDYLIPPITKENMSDECHVIPPEPSGQIMWTIRRSFDAAFKIQNRLLSRAQRSLHDQARNALVAVGGLVDLLGWVQLNWQELMERNVTDKLHELANYYRGSVDGEKKGPVNWFDDVVFLTSYFTNRCVEYIRGTISAMTGLLESQPVLALRLQLSIALAVTLDFATNVIRTLTSDNILAKADKFLQTEFPFVLNALETAKNMVVPPKEKTQ